MTTGVMSVLAAVLASIQTFLNYAERAEKHRVASIKCGAFRREIDHFFALPPERRVDTVAFCNEMRVRLDNILEESPPLSVFEDEFPEKDKSPIRRRVRSAGH
jgi:hypothetical protein